MEIKFTTDNSIGKLDECDQQLVLRNRWEEQNFVALRVFKSQGYYTESPVHHDVCWQGACWQAVVNELPKLEAAVKKVTVGF